MATYYGIAAGNFNTSSTWASSSGGAGGAGTPGSGDACILDANTPSGIKISASQTIGSLDASTFVGTLDVSSIFTLTIDTGDLILGSGTVANANANNKIFVFTGATAAYLQSSGNVLGSVTVNKTGGSLTLLDALINSGGGTLTVTNGGFYSSNYSITGGQLSSNNTNTRTVDLGSSTVIMQNIGAQWSTFTTTNMTFTSTGKVSFYGGGSGTTSPSIDLGTLTFGTLAFNENLYSSGAVFVFNNGTSASATATEIKLYGPLTLFNSQGAGTFIAGDYTFDDSAGALAIICRGTTRWDWSKSSGTVDMGKTSLHSVRGTGGATWTTKGFDLANNTGVTFVPASGGGLLVNPGLSGGFL